MSDKKKTRQRAISSPLQVVWKNPDDGEEYGLDVTICHEFGCLILGGIDDPRVQHHMAKAHREPSGLLSEIGMQRMAAAGYPIVQGQTVAVQPMPRGLLQ